MTRDEGILAGIIHKDDDGSPSFLRKIEERDELDDIEDEEYKQYKLVKRDPFFRVRIRIPNPIRVITHVAQQTGKAISGAVKAVGNVVTHVVHKSTKFVH